MNKATLYMLFLLLTCGICFGQSSYRGLAPGKSTRAEAERVFGLPVKSVSSTLIEYRSPEPFGKIYLQYRDDSQAAVVERIELTCKVIKVGDGYQPNECARIWEKEAAGSSYDVHESDFGEVGQGWKLRDYFGPPRYMVFTRANSNEELRWAFYSKELYEAAAPKPVGCTGTLLGDWETNQGQMKIVRTGGHIVNQQNGSNSAPISGTYSANRGTFVGKISGKSIEADWKDDTGTGKLSLRLLSLSSGPKVSGEWQRTSGTGPKEGKWEGRCVETNQ